MNGRNSARDATLLIDFLSALSLYLEAGYDLAYAWKEVEALPWTETFRNRMASSGATMAEKLEALESADPARALWWRLLRESYLSGVSVGPVLSVLTTTLERERERRLRRFLEGLSTRTNVCLILFFLPPIFALIFYPLVSEITRLF